MSEHKIQVALVDELTWRVKPELFFYAVPNGGLRNLRVAQQLKAEGLKPGVADLCFMLPEGRSAYLEMKTDTGRLSPYQEGFKHRCDMLGHPWAMARSVSDALDVLAGWKVLK